MPHIIKGLFKLISILIALGLVLAGSAFGIFNYLNSPPQGDFVSGVLAENDPALKIEEGNILVLEVRNGESAISVGQRLAQSGIIRSQYFWRFISRLEKEFIKTGTYRIELPASQLSIYSVLIEGSQILIRVTVPEGVTLTKTAAILEDAEICDAADFLAAAHSQDLLDQYQIPGTSMEGYLYPDTYLFPLEYAPEKVIQAMADNFFVRLAEIAPQAFSMSNSEINNRVVLASIVEREYRVDEEAALMAGVFYNRLRINMALQSCATVEYIITEIQGKPHPSVIYNRDLEIRDPYNTYMYAGLPPGPISAPGAVALAAAFEPKSSDYFYFRLTDPAAGRHYFSTTLDEHIQAGALIPKGY